MHINPGGHEGGSLYKISGACERTNVCAKAETSIKKNVAVTTIIYPIVFHQKEITRIIPSDLNKQVSIIIQQEIYIVRDDSFPPIIVCNIIS